MHIKDYKLDNMCATLEISKRTYYKYRNAEDKDYYDYLLIKEIFDESKKTYGYRRICDGLLIKYGVIFNHKKVQRIMAKYSLKPEYVKRIKIKPKYRQIVENVKPNLIKRNFIWFSLFKIVPPVLRSAVHYQDWWSSPTATESVSDFINRYSILDFLPELTGVNSDKDCFIFFDNESTHDTGYCQPPEYTPIGRGGVSELRLDLIKNQRWKDDRGFHG